MPDHVFPNLMRTIIASCPFDRPDPALVAAIARTRALAVLDLGREAEAARAALLRTSKLVDGEFAVRLSRSGLISAEALPARVTCVVVEFGLNIAVWSPRQMLVQVTSLDEARKAVAAGAAGLIAKGHEAGGRIGEETAFVLIQRLMDADLGVPVWVQGGIGRHTAAACMAAGAAGVYIDEQLSRVRESQLDTQIARAVDHFDGNDTVVVHGHRVYTRPDLPVAGHENDYTVDDVAELLGSASLQDNLVPMGQAAAFAGSLAQRFRTTAGVIRAFEQSMSEQLRLAAAIDPMARCGPLARSFGTDYPLAQGPMTRVSDRAAFAGSVAAAGALPFIALSLMRGPQIEELLQETSAQLGDRPWGVGILGFVPAELREEQLEAIRRFKPPFALIAGGRPSQSRPLESEGIVTFLHVPSPRLLEMFLKEGARRFVFEGRECGGHVGPRSSFALWEAQIERLLQFDKLAEVQVLFAGGIHDARSAAMVAAMAAPLAARGAQIGALMGTAYLLTHEATQSGAIKPGFQRAAIDCQHTVLLETSPGHATRCVDSEYVRTFEQQRAELAASGVPQDQAWLQLEALNLGRLRIASKGLRRDKDRLVDVDEATQAAEGMFMIGQVAALRNQTCSIAELHANVIEGGSERLRALSPEAAAAGTGAEPEPEPVDVAIVGMASIFPGAEDLAGFWANILAARNLITEVSPQRWNPEIYYDPAAVGENAGDRTPSKWGGFLPTVDFDPLKWGIPPNSLAAIEPVQLLSLEVAGRALADAMVDEQLFDRERASVIFGAEAGADMSGAYGFRALFRQYVGELPAELDAVLPSLTEDSFPGVLANVIAGRIANRLDFGGVNYTVDAACASSLAAVDAAVKELTRGSSDFVLCGGTDFHNTIYDYLLFSSVHALSPTGQCRTFDATADGIVLGEGVACLALKRLADAERDGDRIYAVIKGVAGSSDGRSLGLTAPRKDGQKRALRRAYRQSGVSPADVGLVEAHGTGTVVGDRTELATLTEIYQEAGAPAGACTLGSVKSQIGHTKCAAGVAGLIKAALSIYTGVRPPTLHVTQPNPGWNRADSPFEFRHEARPWLSDHRAAAVSALGFGGTNFHVVLENHEAANAPLRAGDEWPAELLLFRGDKDEAMARVAKARAWLNGTGRLRLRDLARTLASEGDGPVHVAVLAATLDEARARLEAAASGNAGKGVHFADRAVKGGKLAFVFPGQGSQRLNMFADLFVQLPTLRRVLNFGPQYLDRIYPLTAYSDEERAAQNAALTDTRCAQPAMGMMGLAMAALLEQFGVRPDYLAGHSYGELVALCCAGAFDEQTLIELSEARAACIMQAAGDAPGCMAAVSAGADEVRGLIEKLDGVVIANYNAPAQVVISGTDAGVALALERISEAGLSARKIPVACAFHSPVVSRAQDLLAERLAGCDIHELHIPVWSNAAAAPYLHSAEGVRAQLAEQVAKPVRFVEQIEAMYQSGVRIFVEAGPGRVLSGLIARTLKGRPHRVVACDDPGGPALPAFLDAIAELAVLGVSFHADALFLGRDAERVDLDQVPERSRSTWLINGQMAQPAFGEAPSHGYVPVTGPVISVGGPAIAAAAPAGDEREQAMLEYLRSVREMIAAQRDVMMNYLGAPVASTPAIEGTIAAPAVAVQPSVDAVPVAAAAAGDAAGTTDGTVTGVEDITAILLAIVSERTGYPVEMLDLDLDLEAELSIDSIKRIEILGQLREQVGLGASAEQSEDAIIEQLAALKTLRALVDWLESHRSGTPAESTSSEQPPATVAAESAADSATDAPVTARQYRLKCTEAPAPGQPLDDLAEKNFVLVNDGRGIGNQLAKRIEAAGGTVIHVAADGADDTGTESTVDVWVDLACLAKGAGPESIVQLFKRLQQALRNGTRSLVTASPCGGRFGLEEAVEGSLLGGVGGLMKTIAREYPQVSVRAVDVDAAAKPDQLAARLFDEICWPGGPVEVGYAADQRLQLAFEPVEAPVTDAGLALNQDSVVLVIGGARGICARLAVALAGRYGCHLELVGRTPSPDEQQEAEDTAAAPDAAALRRALVARGMASPAEIESECARLLAARSVAATLDEVRQAGGQLRYHACDATDATAFGALIERIYADHGRIDAVIHGAGVLEDKLLRDKSEASFRRVYDTKVVPARVIADKIRSDTRFVLFFSSVSALFGNRGQADYAAANEALDRLAASLRHRIDGRVASINWGPWAGTGMIGPELAREYARRGIELIPPDQGVGLILAALDGAAAGDSQWLIFAGEPGVYEFPHSAAGASEDPAHAASAAVDLNVLHE